MDSSSFKEEGNKLFKAGSYEEALGCYTKALNLHSSDSPESAVLLKNRAACHLKLDQYAAAKTDCSDALEIAPNDPKCLYRRCQALEKLGSYEEAYVDAVRLMKIDPKNTAIQPVLKRLNPIVQDKIQKRNSTDNKVTQMFELVFQKSGEDSEKRKQAANNLIVLAKDDAGAEKIYQSNGVKSLERLIDTEKDSALRVTAIRVLACMTHNSLTRAVGVFDSVGVKKLCVWLGSAVEDESTAAANLLRSLILAVTGLEDIKKQREKHEAQRKADPSAKLRPFVLLHERIGEEGQRVVDLIMPALIVMLHHGKVSSYGRDNAMELIIKFVTRTEGCGWPKKFIEAGGVNNLLEVAGTIKEQGGLSISSNSRMHVSLCLSKVYDDLLSDQERDLFKSSVDGYFTDMFGDDIMESKLEAVMALAALLQGPVDVGNMIL